MGAYTAMAMYMCVRESVVLRVHYYKLDIHSFGQESAMNQQKLWFGVRVYAFLEPKLTTKYSNQWSGHDIIETRSLDVRKHIRTGHFLVFQPSQREGGTV